MQDDHIARCLFDGGTIRLAAVVTTATVTDASQRHGVVGLASVALSRAMTSGLLLATMTKEDERVTLQLHGGGSLGSITVDAASSGRVRGFVKNRDVVATGVPNARVSVGRLVGTDGVCSVVRDFGSGKHFSGQTSLVDGEIDTDVEHHVTHSEQIDSAIACEALLTRDLDIGVSAGVLVQALPGNDRSDVIADIRRRLRAGALAQALAHHSSDLAAEDVASRILGELASTLEVLDLRPVTFSCSCSRERAASTLTLLGESDLNELIADPGEATVACEFCRSSYTFAGDELASIRDQVRTSAAHGPS